MARIGFLTDKLMRKLDSMVKCNAHDQQFRLCGACHYEYQEYRKQNACSFYDFTTDELQRQATFYIILISWQFHPARFISLQGLVMTGLPAWRGNGADSILCDEMVITSRKSFYTGTPRTPGGRMFTTWWRKPKYSPSRPEK